MKLTKFIKNLLSVYSANFVVGITGIATIPLVVSALGKEKYGIFSVYAVLASYVALVDCGVTKHFVRLIASDRSFENQTDCLKKAFGWYLVLAVMLTITLPLSIYLVSHLLFPVAAQYQSEIRWITILVVVEYCLSIPIMLSQTLTISNEKFKRLSSYNVITGSYRYLLMIVAAFLYKKASMIVAFLAFRRLIDIFCAKKILHWPNKAVWSPMINFYEFKSILAKSSILSLAQFLQTTVVAIGSILVNKHFGIRVLGNYRAAFDLGGKVWFLSNGIGMLLFPKFSQVLADDSGRRQISRDIYKLLMTSWTAYLLIGVFGILSAKYFLPLIKLDSEQIVFFFIILFVGICINAHSNVAYEFLLADGRYGTVAKLSVTSLTLLWVAFELLKSILGPYSIAWAWIISQSVYAILADELLIATNNMMEINIKKRFLYPKTCLLAIILTCLVAEIYYKGATSMTLIISVAISGSLYLLSLIRKSQILSRK
jgi:O-antigen/teichoic acid export membrane protein